MCGRRRYPSRYPCGKGPCSPAEWHRSPSEDVAAGRDLEQPQGPRLERKAELCWGGGILDFPFLGCGNVNWNQNKPQLSEGLVLSLFRSFQEKEGMNIAEMLSNTVEGSSFFYNLEAGEMKLEVQVFFLQLSFALSSVCEQKFQCPGPLLEHQQSNWSLFGCSGFSSNSLGSFSADIVPSNTALPIMQTPRLIVKTFLRIYFGYSFENRGNCSAVREGVDHLLCLTRFFFF